MTLHFYTLKPLWNIIKPFMLKGHDYIVAQVREDGQHVQLSAVHPAPYGCDVAGFQTIIPAKGQPNEVVVIPYHWLHRQAIQNKHGGSVDLVQIGEWLCATMNGKEDSVLSEEPTRITSISELSQVLARTTLTIAPESAWLLHTVLPTFCHRIGGSNVFSTICVMKDDDKLCAIATDTHRLHKVRFERYQVYGRHLPCYGAQENPSALCIPRTLIEAVHACKSKQPLTIQVYYTQQHTRFEVSIGNIHLTAVQRANMVLPCLYTAIQHACDSPYTQFTLPANDLINFLSPIVKSATRGQLCKITIHHERASTGAGGVLVMRCDTHEYRMPTQVCGTLHTVGANGRYMLDIVKAMLPSQFITMSIATPSLVDTAAQYANRRTHHSYQTRPIIFQSDSMDTMHLLMPMLI